MADPESGAEPASDDREAEEADDFADFGPADMAEMTVEEWEAAFDPDSWITGVELLDRVEATLKDKVRRREVFAVVEREAEGRLLAYSDEGYAVVGPDGTVEGEGGVARDVEPIVALCSMPDYEVPDVPEGDLLPRPEEVRAGSGQLGHRLVLVVAAVQALAGLVLLVAPFLVDLRGAGSAVLTTVVGLAFLAVGAVLVVLVANARLSDRFRAAEYRERLRAAGVGTDERPDFVPDGAEGEAAEDPRT